MVRCPVTPLFSKVGWTRKALVRVMTSHFGNVTEIRYVQPWEGSLLVSGPCGVNASKKNKNKVGCDSSPGVSGGNWRWWWCCSMNKKKKVGYYPYSRPFSAGHKYPRATLRSRPTQPPGRMNTAPRLFSVNLISTPPPRLSLDQELSR